MASRREEIFKVLKKVWELLRSKKRFFELILYIIFLVLIIYMFIVAACNIFDIETNILNINPPEPYHIIPIDLSYPSSNPGIPFPISFLGFETGNRTVNNPDIILKLCLKYKGSLYEGNQVDINASGYVEPKGQDYLAVYRAGSHFVLAGFEGSQLYKNRSDSSQIFHGGQFVVELQNKNNPKIVSSDCPKEGEPFLITQTITWPIQGDYYPYIIMVSNDENVSTIAFPDYKIHVAGVDIIEQKKTERITTALTIVLFVFTLITCSGYVIEKFKEWNESPEHGDGYEGDPSNHNKGAAPKQPNTQKLETLAKRKKNR